MVQYWYFSFFSGICGRGSWGIRWDWIVEGGSVVLDPVNRLLLFLHNSVGGKYGDGLALDVNHGNAG